MRMSAKHESVLEILLDTNNLFKNDTIKVRPNFPESTRKTESKAKKWFSNF